MGVRIETFKRQDDVIKGSGNSSVPGEFPTKRPVTRSFDVFFDLRMNKRLSKQWWGWWFQTLSCPLWRHRNGIIGYRQLHHTVKQMKQPDTNRRGNHMPLDNLMPCVPSVNSTDGFRMTINWLATEVETTCEIDNIPQLHLSGNIM